MIHILTVHWQSDDWVDIQLKYLERYFSAPFKTYAFLNDLPVDHSSKFFYSSTEAITSHAIKLNLLADIACMGADSDADWLIFIDGDAFPIGDITGYIEQHLLDHPLIAIQRSENDGDLQPHPSFCATTVGFWKEIKGDWKKGYQWKNAIGKLATDVGGNLLEKLEQHQVPWLPMHRSNKRELHKLWFGIYEDLIYHHGAGFREPLSRVDLEFHALEKHPILYWFVYRIRNRLIRRRVVARNSASAEEIYRKILSDEHFYLWFQGVDQ